MGDHNVSKVDVRGCKVRVMRGGKGPTLLFLHGAGGAATWLPFMQTLARKFDVIVPSHPGFGETDAPAWLDNIHDMAYFYLDFIEELGVQNVHLVGLSLGGWIAAEIAVRNASRLKTVTLVGSAGIYLKDAQHIDTFLCSDEQRIRDCFYDEKLAEEMIARLLKPENEDVFLKNELTTAKMVWHPRSYDPNLHKWLHRINVPTLLLWGEQDRLKPKEYAYEFQRLIPGSKAIVLPECGHLPNVEKADRFCDELSSFVTQAGV